jgi:hypothetical protein
MTARTVNRVDWRTSIISMSLCVVAATCVLRGSAGAQQPDSSAVRRTRLTGTIASILTTRPVPLADIRLSWIDSTHTDKEFYVDTAKSRIAMTDSAGTFTVRNLLPGHYLMNVRRIGFTPFEGFMTVDTAAMEMELALDQVMTVLPPVRITEGAINRVTQRLDRVGFITRSRSGFSGNFLTRKDIIDSHPVDLRHALTKLGLSISDSYTLDNIPTDWGELGDYPLDLVVGIEVYWHGMPVEYSMTRRGRLTFSNDRGTPIRRANVLLWTYIP